MKKKLRPPVKIHGGKYYLSSWIIENFPENYETLSYIEPYVGAGSVFLNKKPSEIEAISDINTGLIQIWRALRDEPSNFIGRLKRTKYAENSFLRVKNREQEGYKDYMEHAVTEFVLRRMSRGGLKQAFAWSERLRGGIPGDLNAWNTILKELPAIAERCQDVFIFNKTAIDVIRAFDDYDTLFYCDPPYLHETRVSTNTYDTEMTTDDHVELSEVLKECKAKIILSGYMSPLYKRLYSNWRYVKRSVANHSSQQKVKKHRTEVLWMNY